MTAPGCQARNPIPVLFGREWQICGQPAVRRHVYRCGCGHVREGVTCAGHEPRPDSVGCARCWDQGHECPMTWEEVPA